MGVMLSAIGGFVMVWAVVRIVGKRGLSQLSAFDFILMIVLGDLLSQAVVKEDTSATGAMIAIATFAVMTVLSSWLTWRFPKSRVVLEGVPTLLIRDGELIDEALTMERIDLTDLREAARQAGHPDIDQLQWAILEVDGKFSFFPRDPE